MVAYEVQIEDLIGIRDQLSTQSDLINSTTGHIAGTTTVLLQEIVVHLGDTQTEIAGLMQELTGIIRAADSAASADWLGPDSDAFRTANADLIAAIARSQTHLESVLTDHHAATTQISVTLTGALEEFTADADASQRLTSQLAAAVAAEVDSYEKAFNGTWNEAGPEIVAAAIGAATVVALPRGVGMAPLGPMAPPAGPPTPFGELLDKAGRRAGGPAEGLPTDSATLARLLEDARARGDSPLAYRELLAQYWASMAAERAGIDLDTWDPSTGVSGNSQTVTQVYEYYADLYLHQPGFQWAGLANLVGPGFAAGFLDIESMRQLAAAVAEKTEMLPDAVQERLPPGLQEIRALANLSEADANFYETKFLSMQKQIFLDQGMMHEAYEASGMAGINELRSAGLIEDKDVQTWKDIDKGITNHDPELLKSGALGLADREQNRTIANDWDDMHNHLPSGPAFTYLATIIGKPSVPEVESPGEALPFSVSGGYEIRIPRNFFQPLTEEGLRVSYTLETPLPDIDISNQDSRWQYFETKVFERYQEMLEGDGHQVRDEVTTDLGTRIAEERLANRADDIAKQLMTDWEFHSDAEADISFRW